jgi:serine/threonine protein kinase
MTTTERERVLELFSAALGLPAAGQSVFLHREAAGEPQIIAEVLSLLKLDQQADAAGFLNGSALQIEAEHLARGVGDERVGESFGPFKIVRLIGTGGMGAIYLAERDDEQYRRRVAIKVIKRGMDTDHVLRRFGNERQILANLSHPNIARLYTGGATEDGLPYFVMEYIEGSPLIEYADRHALSVNQRLKLFRKVCAAVQYAHQNLVVHRDLKPTNILVTRDGEPKLLDFGIAKFLDAATDATVTEFRALTPEYASPEQIRGQAITTASDVYSLGVLLFELLTGQRPYRLPKRTPEEITKAICEQEPPKPSTAIRELRHNDLKTTTPLEFRNPKTLRGDLDNIILMALRKDPQRRYSSVAEFSEDIQRYVEGRPVSARKDTARYRLAKFIGRHRIAVAAALVVLITLTRRCRRHSLAGASCRS